MSNQSFKNACENNIGVGYTTIYTAPVGETSMVLQLDVSNITGSGVLCDIAINDVSEGVQIEWVKNTLISTGSTLSTIQGQKLVLEPGDELKVKSNTVNSLDAVASVMEDVNDNPGTELKSKGVSALGWTLDSGKYYQTIYTAPGGMHSQLIQLDVCNITNSGVLCDIELFDSSAAKIVRLGLDLPIPVGGTLQYISGQKIVLDPGDYITVRTPTEDSLDVIVSLMEDINL